MRQAEIAGWTATQSKKTFEEIWVAIGHSLNDLGSSHDGEDVEDEHDEETEQGKLSEDDEPGWRMGTITNTVQQRLMRIQQNQMKHNELTQPCWEDAPDNFCEQHKMYGTSELRVPAVDQPQTKDDATAPPPTTVVDLLEILVILPGTSHRPQQNSRPGSSHIRLGSVKPQSASSISSREPAGEPDSSILLKAKPVQSGSFYTAIFPPANYHIDIILWQRDSDSSCVCR